MASGKPILTVILAPQAENDLIRIWGDNLAKYSFEHAESYEGFLKVGINSLARSYDQAKKVDQLSEFRYVTLKRRSRGEGHHVIFKVDEPMGIVKVLRIFHTKMDLTGRLEAEI